MAEVEKPIWLCILSLSLYFLLLGSPVQGGQRANLFLMRPFTEYHESLPGEVDDSYMVRAPSSHKVLYGHYSAILENRKRGQPKPSVKGRKALNEIVGPEATPVVSHILKTYRESYQSFIQGAINMTLSPKNSEYTGVLQKCTENAATCTRMTELSRRCHAICLAGTNPIIEKIPDLVLDTMDKFCSPIETIFQKMFDYTADSFSQFKRFRKFVAALQTGKRGLQEVATLAADAVLPVLIEKVRTDLMPLRTVTAALDLASKQVALFLPAMEDALINRLCTSLDDLPALSEIMNAFYSDPSTIDVVLGGQALMASIAKYLPGRFQMPFSATIEGLRLMTGSICGLVAGLMDSSPQCDELGGFPSPGIPLPPHVPDMIPECMESAAGTSIIDDGSMDDTNNMKGKESESDTKKEGDGAAAAPSARKKRTVGLLPLLAAAVARDGDGNGKDGSPSSKIKMGIHSRKKRSLVVGGNKKRI